ncbi:unnamed protein product, partial [Amoebophrya sp. A25]|eukprot:GSA25T00006724001.1
MLSDWRTVTEASAAMSAKDELELSSTSKEDVQEDDEVEATSKNSNRVLTNPNVPSVVENAGALLGLDDMDEEEEKQFVAATCMQETELKDGHSVFASAFFNNNNNNNGRTSSGSNN